MDSNFKISSRYLSLKGILGNIGSTVHRSVKIPVIYIYMVAFWNEKLKYFPFGKKEK